MGYITYGRFLQIFGLAISILFSPTTNAEELTATRGDVFKMPCFSTPNANTYYIDLMFQPSAPSSTSRRIVKYDPSTGSMKNVDSEFNGRLQFTMNTAVGDANTLSVTNIRIEDEGMYSCVLRGFDIDNDVEVSNSLTVYVPPVIEAPVLITTPLIAGEQLTDVASCTAMNGKPDAEVRWFNERLLFNQTVSSQTGDELGTNTVTSVLKLSPTRFYNDQIFHCEIKHATLPEGRNVTMIKLNVQFPPGTPVITPINDNTQLKCTAEGNPTPTITWTMPNNYPSPDSNVATIISPTDPERQNDTYLCTATNGIGPPTSFSITTSEAVSYVEIVNTSNTGVIVGAVVGSLVVLLIIVVLVYYFFIRKHREKDSGPYNPGKISRATDDDDEGGWSRSSGRPIIQHANESLNKNAPPSPTHPPPQDDEDASDNSQSDVEEFTEGHDVDLNSPLTGGDDDDVGGAIVSKNSVNFQHRRQRPSTSPHRHSQNRGYHQPEPAPRTPQVSDPHYEVPPKEYYDDEYDHDDGHMMGDHPQDDSRFYDLPEDRYPGYQPRYDEPPHHEEHLPPYTDNTVQYATIDHDYNAGKPRTRPPYHEPVEYAEIRSKGAIV